MRWVALALLGVTVGCGGNDTGALIVLHGSIAADHVEVILASPEATEQLAVKQRKSVDALDEEPVTYYRQRSTTMPIDVRGIELEAYTVRVQPNPSPEQFVPFVLVYDADANLIAAGRVVGTSTSTPMAIEIPNARLERYDVDLEAIAPPSAKGMTADQGRTVTCQRDGVTSGAAWKFGAGNQLRLAFTTTWPPYDLDCDDHDVEFQHDCNDLDPAFNPDEAEVCAPNSLGGGRDTNCDGAFAGQTACTITDRNTPPDPSNTCAGHMGCGIDQCRPDQDAACRCVLDRCVQQICKAEYGVDAVSNTRAYCAPAFVKLHGVCPDNITCTATVLAMPPEWKIDLASGSSTNFDATAQVVAGGDLWIRATPAMPADVDLFGEIDIEITGGPIPRHELISLGASMISGECEPSQATTGVGGQVPIMGSPLRCTIANP